MYHASTLPTSSVQTPNPKTSFYSPTPPPLLPRYINPDLLAGFSTPSELQQLHAQLAKSAAPLSATLPLPRVAAVCALSSPSAFAYARRLLRSAAASELALWSSALRAFSDSAAPADALCLLSRLLGAGFLPDAFALCSALRACSRSASLDVGRPLHALALKLRLLASDLYLLNALLHMYASCGAVDDARLLFATMPARDAVSWNIVITRLTKLGLMDSAHEMFDEMPERTVRAWTAMIAGHVQCGNPREAVCLFGKMEAAGARPDEVTVVAVLTACADMGALDLGQKVREYADSCGFRSNVRVCNTLIDMYIKCGCVDTAREVFDEMAERTVVSWSAMIGGHAIHGQGSEALQLFSEMIRAGVRPNGVTFVGLLHACSHMGLLEDGRRFFANMTQDYGITPEIEHYGCVVDLLSRAGLLKEALEFIRNMPVEPNGVVWGALLGGARVHKNIEVGEEAIRHLSRLDPLNDGYYVVLSNIYAGARRWEDVARVRRLMQDRGVKKTPGWSTISLDGVVHEFVAGESDHPRAEDIYAKWDTLLEQLKHRGYIPDTSVVLLDMDEGEKERVLYRHSEKLATVFGLMSTSPGTPIRIMKNLRVCSDCHTALKLISEVADRQIVVRDRNRFHCFKEGSCSCRDYW